MCTARIKPEYVLEAFKNGADGVMIAGCYPQDCHYRTGFDKAAQRVDSLKDALREAGINEKRLMIESASASEGKKIVKLVTEFSEKLRSFGPIGSELEISVKSDQKE